MALIIGLTGGIGAGKSTASAFLAGLGVPVVDADGISRALTGPGGRGSAAVAEAFGSGMIDASGAMNRAAMRELVFRDPDALRRLEAVLHPLIGEEIDASFEKHSDSPLVIYDCPLLWRANFRRPALSRILVIDASDAVRLERILSRPGMTRETATRMMAAQPPRSEILRIADDVIVNEDDEASLKERLTVLHKFWMAQTR
ncbi:MAG: dephospho-CoA kinase [Sutterella sp.]|nr:dephospho-CoA kinase [Sutterella sp.]